jgi:hypothetical protein
LREEQCGVESSKSKADLEEESEAATLSAQREEKQGDAERDRLYCDGIM